MNFKTLNTIAKCINLAALYSMAIIGILLVSALPVIGPAFVMISAAVFLEQNYNIKREYEDLKNFSLGLIFVIWFSAQTFLMSYYMSR